MNILILKIGAIGDVVMASSMIPVLKKKYPLSHISWLGGNGVKDLISTFLGVDNVISINEKLLFQGIFLQRIFIIINIWRQLLFTKYDLVINGHPDKRYKILLWFARSLKTVSFNRNPNFRIVPVPGRHHSDEYARLALELDGSATHEFYPLVTVNINFPKVYQQELSTVCISPGGAKNILREDALRRWPIANYVQLAQRLIARNIKVILIGAPTDSWVLPYFEGLLVENLVGKINLLELLNYFKNSNLLIAHDSGPVHLANLVNTPIISLFGPTPPSSFAPRFNNSQFLVSREKLSCSPCYDGRLYAECKNNLCMQQITVDQVYDTAISMLTK